MTLPSLSFSYAFKTINPLPSRKSKSISGGAIAGITIGVVVIVTLCAFLLLFLWKQRLGKSRLIQVVPTNQKSSSDGSGLLPVDQQSQFLSTPTPLSSKRRMFLEQQEPRSFSNPQQVLPHPQLRQDVTAGTTAGIEGLTSQNSTGREYGRNGPTVTTRESNEHENVPSSGLWMSETATSIAETAPPPYQIPHSLTSPTVSSPGQATSSSVYLHGQ